MPRGYDYKQPTYPTENEYTTEDVMRITGWSQPKLSELFKAGKIDRTRKGYYTRQSVDEYQADREERLNLATST